MMERRRMERLDHWWAEVMPSYPALGKVWKACLSIFTGPRIEQSFSVMKDFMDRKSNHLAVRSYSAIQTIKYDLKARNTTTFSDFHQFYTGFKDYSLLKAVYLDLQPTALTMKYGNILLLTVCSVYQTYPIQ